MRCTRTPLIPPKTGIQGRELRPKNWVPASAGTSGKWFAASSLEHLVPPLLQRGVVLGEIAVVEIDEARLLLGGEADALLQVGRHDRVGDGRVVAHVD